MEELDKVYENGVHAVRDLSLEVADGEFLVLVGPSGCGKTSALRMVAGLEEISDGTLSIGGRVVNDLTPKERDVAMVFQNYALYPHLNVADNIAFGLRLRKTPRTVVSERVGWAAKLLDLTPYLERRPKELSGGQRQRVAMGRAIVRQPQVFLMDEPLSNLDAKLRVQMRGEVSALQRELGTTTVYVTHDQVEALTMGDRVAVMRHGRLVQVDRPQALYERPADLFVAGFIGSPAMNFVQARLHGSNGQIVAELGSTTFELPARELPASVVARNGGDVIIGLRPEHLDVAAGNGRPVLRAPVTLAEPVGSEVIVHLELDAPPVVTRDTSELAHDSGAAERPIFDGARTHLTACLRSRGPVERGQTLELSVDPASLHFFDPETEVALA
jgi:multiple sugar transport system ATP-binding protein